MNNTKQEDAREKAWNDFINSAIPFSGENALSKEIFYAAWNARSAEWRDVERDGLPEIETEKLWQTDEGSMFVGYLSDDKRLVYFRNGESYWHLDDCTAWTEKPEPFARAEVEA